MKQHRLNNKFIEVTVAIYAIKIYKTINKHQNLHKKKIKIWKIHKNYI
jgi:hypothetical protein